MYELVNFFFRFDASVAACVAVRVVVQKSFVRFVTGYGVKVCICVCTGKWTVYVCIYVYACIYTYTISY